MMYMIYKLVDIGGLDLLRLNLRSHSALLIAHINLTYVELNKKENKNVWYKSRHFCFLQSIS